MINFAYIYALPGFSEKNVHTVKTDTAAFHAVAIDFSDKDQAVTAALDLVENHQVNMIELCGGLASADLVARVKSAVGPKVAVGQVMYGPEYRRTLVDLLAL